MARDIWDKREKWEFSYKEKEKCKGQGVGWEDFVELQRKGKSYSQKLHV